MTKQEILKELQSKQPVLNLNAVNKQNLPKITQSLQKVIQAQDNLNKQNQTLVQTASGMKGQQSQQTSGAPISEDDENTGSPYPGTVDGTGESHAYEPKGVPEAGVPPIGAASTPMGMKDMAADSIPVMENEDDSEEPTRRYEIEDHINDLLKSMFGFKYYFGSEQEEPPTIIQKKDIQGSLFPMKPVAKEEYPYFDNLSNNRKNELLSDREFVQVMKLLDFDKFPEALNALIRMKEKMLSENLVNSKMFSIIAENEIPTISKGDFISYLKSKKDEKFNS